MKNTIEIECQSEVEREAIEIAMNDPEFKAAAIVFGILYPLSEEQQKKIIGMLRIYLDLSH